MARLTRQTLALFGAAGGTSNFGQFGSQAASAPVTTKNIATIQALAAWADGWQDAVALGQAPYLQDMNGVMYVHSYQQVYTFQDGIPEWDSGTTYYIGAVVKNLGNSGYVEYYVSLANTNTGNALPTRTTDAHWQFDHAVKTSSGLVIPGTPTNDDAAIGNVGEFVRAYAAAVAQVSTGSWVNIASIALTAGDWDVSGVVEMAVNGAALTGVPIVNGAVSQFSGNTVTDHVEGDNWARQSFSNSAYVGSISIPAWRVSVAGSTTVYLKAETNYSSGTPQYSGRISARRVR